MVNPKVLQEFARCRDGVEGFIFFCKNHVRIEDKESHKDIPFVLYKDQEEVIRGVFKGEWPIILKARRIGMTWLFAAYALWLCTFYSNRTVAVLNQDKDYANDFLDRVKFMIERLPRELQPVVTTDQRSRLGFAHKGGHSSIRSVASTKRAARSISGDLIIFDEAAYHRFFKKALKAAMPAVETSGKFEGKHIGGTVAVISTSDGPSGDFYEYFKRAQEATPEKPSKLTARFSSWRARHGRSDAWYEEEKLLHSEDPLYMAHEYPETWEEAFLGAQGRVYPLFMNKAPYIHTMTNEEFKAGRHLYRAVDWGGTDAFVCLWGIYTPGPSRLTVDPSCKNLIREMLAYKRDETTSKPVDADNHAPDCLRYMVISNGKDGVRGWLHIYREMYIPNSAQKGLSPVDLAGRIKLMSGNEVFEKSVGDRTRPDSLLLFNQLGIPITKARQLKSVGSKSEIEQGIDRVNVLVVGTSNAKSSMKEVRHPSLIVQNVPGTMTAAVYKRGSPFV